MITTTAQQQCWVVPCENPSDNCAQAVEADVPLKTRITGESIRATLHDDSLRAIRIVDWSHARFEDAQQRR